MGEMMIRRERYADRVLLVNDDIDIMDRGDATTTSTMQDEMCEVDSAGTSKEAEDSDTRWKYARKYVIGKTFALGFTWLLWGGFSSLVTTTLPDIRMRVDVDYEELSRAMAAGSIGALFGHPVGGVVADRWVRARDLHIIVFCSLQVFTVAIRPWVRHLWVLGVLTFSEGFFSGFFSNGMNNMFDRLWGERVAGPRHAMSTVWTVGELVAPLLCRPFYLKSEGDIIPTEGLANASSAITNSSVIVQDCLLGTQDNNVTIVNHNLSLPVINTMNATLTSMNLTNCSLYAGVNMTGNNTSNNTMDEEIWTAIEYPYLILTVFTIFPIIAVCGFYYKDRTSGEKYYAKSAHLDNHKRGHDEDKPVPLRQIFSFKRCGQGSNAFGGILFLLICLYYFTLCFTATPFGNFIMAYSVDTLGFTKSEASLLIMSQKIAGSYKGEKFKNNLEPVELDELVENDEVPLLSEGTEENEDVLQ
ncbi:unnamed protein product [Owenia fusiformis]|uniref:Uncharacterized protein n=1 Tax=Owenia fusiformis TaxID=6347 RepID=A0A8J1U686_OWEFU|nr:unnamed protein product [Owenia fusiformis]